MKPDQLRQLEEGPSGALELQFNQTVQEHSPKRLVISLNFSNNSKISTGQTKDVLQIEILQPELFKSSIPPFMQLNMSQVLESEDNKVFKEVPP